MRVLAVNPLPAFSLGNDIALCQGQTLVLGVSLPKATYQWSNQSSADTLTIAQTGIYWLRATEAGCSTSDTISVAYISAPVFSLGKDTSLCEGQSVQLNAGSTGATYLWQDGSTAATFTVSSSGLYHVIANTGRCSRADTITVSFIPVPQFSLGRDTFLCTGQQIVLAPIVNTTASLLWQDGSTGLTYTIIKTGFYSLQATNICGMATDTINIVQGYCDIEMPSAFSPNGDEDNDVFKVKYPFPVQRFSMIVYNGMEKKFSRPAISTRAGMVPLRAGARQRIAMYV